MSVYKPRGYEVYLIKLTIGGREQKFRGVSDKAISRSIERQIKRLAAIRATQEAMPVDLAQWLVDLPQRLPAVYEKLIKVGLQTRAATDARRPLTELLYGIIETTPQFEKKVKEYHRNGNDLDDARRKAMVHHPGLYKVKLAGWFHALMSKGDTPDYVLLRVSRVKAMLKGCGFERYEDLDADQLSLWLHEQRRTRSDHGAATSNHYLKAIRSFTKWVMGKLRRYHEPNPFAGVELQNESVDVRRPRRAPMDEEVSRLLEATRHGKPFRDLSPTDREMLYRVALTLGLRAKELASLVPESFTITDTSATVKIKAAYSKHRRQDVLPVPSALVSVLKPWLADRTPGKPLWPGTWKRAAAEMLRRDLDRAGLSYKTDDGFFDFHANRHGAITRGSRIMRLDQLKAFARHGKIEMTLRYMHTNMDDLTAAVGRMPALPGRGAGSETTVSVTGTLTVGEVTASSGTLTGTPDQIPNQTVVRGDSGSSSVGRGRGVEKNTPETPQAPDCSGACASVVTDILQRARRGSNPQPPDRQSGVSLQNRPKSWAIPKKARIACATLAQMGLPSSQPTLGGSSWWPFGQALLQSRSKWLWLSCGRCLH